MKLMQISFSLLLLALPTFSSAQQLTPEAILDKVVKTYNAQYSAERFSVTLRSQITEDGEAGPRMNTTCNVDGKRIEIANPFMKMYVDAQQHVIILPESNTIMLRSNTDAITEEASVNAMVTTVMDATLSGYRTCETIEAGKLRLVFDMPLGATKTDYATTTITYDPKTFELKELLRETVYNGSASTERTEYLEYRTSGLAPVFKGAAIDQVLTNEKPQAQYKEYLFQDLRNAQ